MTKQVKPPLGLMPRNWHIKQRITSIEEATRRYEKAGVEVPNDWCVELDFQYGQLILIERAYKL